MLVILNAQEDVRWRECYENTISGISQVDVLKISEE